MAYSYDGTIITGPDGTLEAPYSILSVVTDVNNVEAIERVGDTVFIKKELRLDTGHVIIPTGIICERSNYLYINGGGFHMDTGCTVINKALGGFGAKVQIASGYFVANAKNGQRPTYVQSAGYRDDFPAAQDGLGNYDGIIYQIEGLNLIVKSEMHLKWYTSNPSSFINNLSIFTYDYAGALTPAQLSYGTTLEKLATNSFSLSGDFSNLGKVSTLIEPSFYITGTVSMAGYLWSATLIDVVNPVFIGGTWNGLIAPNAINDGQQTRFLNTAKFTFNSADGFIEGVKVLAIPTVTGSSALSENPVQTEIVTTATGEAYFDRLMRREFLDIGNDPKTITTWGIYAFSYLYSVPTEVLADAEITEKVEKSFLSLLDESITETNKSTVDAYTELETPYKMYDKAKAYLYDNYSGEQETFVTRVGDTIDLGAKNLIIDATASQVCTCSPTSVTIKATEFTGNIITTGTVTLQNGATVSGGIIDSNGDSFLSFSGVDSWIVYANATDRDSNINPLDNGTGTDNYRFTYGGDVTYYMRLTSGGDTLLKQVTVTGSGETGVDLGIAGLLTTLPSQIVDATWNSTIEGHTASGTFGGLLQSEKYSGGQIWVNTINGVVGDTPYINGTANNPTSLWSDALLLSASLNLSKFNIANSSLITLTSPAESFDMEGNGWYLNMNGQELSGAYIYGALGIGGSCVSDNGKPYVIEKSSLNDGVNLSTNAIVNFCSLAGDINLTSTDGVDTDDIIIANCSSGIPGAVTPHINASAVTKATNISVRKYSGGMEVTLNANCTMSLEVMNGGNVKINGTGGSIHIRGNVESVTDTSGGSVAIDTDGVIATKADVEASAGGSGATPQEVYDYFVTSNRQDTFKADVSTLATSSEVGALNNLSATQVKAEVDQALTDKDVATKTHVTVVNNNVKKASLLVPASENI